MILVPFPEMNPLARSLASALGADLSLLDWHRFPDGESLMTLPDDMRDADVAILATLRDPDRLALPLRFAAQTARERADRALSGLHAARPALSRWTGHQREAVRRISRREF